MFGCDGYATDDIIIEAIDRAVRDGCDIINLSLSSGAGYADNVGHRVVGLMAHKNIACSAMTSAHCLFQQV